jgi:predicted nucleic acid-binding protein
VTVVLDASMTIAWLFEDERTEAAHGIMLRVVAGGAIVPSLWRLEVANVLRNAVRRGRCDEAFVDRSLARLHRFRIGIDDETDLHAWEATHKLSREEGLTPYDAAYLELAIRKQQPLASCDADLVAAGRRRSVEVLTA